MRAKWMGAAAAVVMACGWASGAEAGTLLFDFGGRSITNDYLSGAVSGSIEVSHGIAHVVYTGNYDVILYPDDNPTEVSGSLGGDFYQKSVVDPSTGLPNLYPSDGDLSLPISFVANKGIFTKDPDQFDIGIVGTGYGQIVGVVNVSGSLNISDFVTSVPIPAAAPMFGAALLALGAAAMLQRRRVA